MVLGYPEQNDHLLDDLYAMFKMVTYGVFGTNFPCAPISEDVSPVRIGTVLSSQGQACHPTSSKAWSTIRHWCHNLYP